LILKNQIVVKLHRFFEFNFVLVQYPQHKDRSYISVEYITSPITRVYGTSQDTFCIEYMYETFCDMIVNYSTYKIDNGSGRQMIYLYRDFVGDTLSVNGCIDFD